jgi:hypothetical protein
MNDRNQTTQLSLFESESPDWRSMSCETQQAVPHVLSQLLLDALEQRALEQHRIDPITTSTTNENDDVS